ncbi:hypothetical protein K7X08_032605 [Anisodus acutangulus]|uniref:Cyclin-dependent kinase inhibitor domain-containing protein n=1 Tax=Anisodus acutangulus TaxID=402998 RepID=A0A9Q1MYG4_9SOLA|nr:hypothetical protein K7X08_032605 [Anisodus acutangulus]
MGRYMRKKFKGIEEVTIMEVSDVDLATKKRKIYDGDVKPSPTLLRFRSISDVVISDKPESLVSPASELARSLVSPASELARSLVSPASELARSLVSPASSLENYASSEPAVSSTSCLSRNSKSLYLDENCREVMVASKENTQMTKMPKNKNSRRRITPENMGKRENSPPRIMPEKIPTRNDIEEFFAACEKDMFKRFREKYNFDLEKEEPLEGRYEWVQRIGGT